MIRSLALVFVLAVCATAAAAQSDAETAIKKLMNEQVAAWNRGDVEAFMDGYWRSERLMFVSGDKITYGWQATLDNYRKSYPTRAAMGTLTFSGLEVQKLSKDAAFVVGSWLLTREKDAPKGKFTLLFRKFREGWRIVADHSS